MNSGSASGTDEETVQALIDASLTVATVSSPGVVQLGVDIPAMVLLAGDVTNSTITPAAVEDLQFTPVAGGIYEVIVAGVFTTAATTTGIEYHLNPGNVAAGAVMYQTRGSSVAAQAFLNASASTTSVAGTSSGSGETFLFARGIFTAHASAPTAIQFYFNSEIAASAVVLKGSKTYLSYRRLL